MGENALGKGSPQALALTSRALSLSSAKTGVNCHRCRGGGRRWRGFLDEDRPAREGEVAGVVVDYVHLAGVEAWLQGLQRQVDLEDDGFAVGGVYFVGHDWFRFVNFRVSL